MRGDGEGGEQQWEEVRGRLRNFWLTFLVIHQSVSGYVFCAAPLRSNPHTNTYSLVFVVFFIKKAKDGPRTSKVELREPVRIWSPSMRQHGPRCGSSIGLFPSNTPRGDDP